MLQEAVHHDFVGEKQINAPGDGCGVGVFLRGKALDVGVGEFGGNVVVKDGGAQDADDFALDAFCRRLNLAARRADKQAGVAVVRVGEGDAFATFRRVVHGSEDDVHLVRLQRRNQAFPVQLLEAAFALHLFAQRLADVDVKAGHLAVARHFGKRRIGAVGGNHQRLAVGKGLGGKSGTESRYK